MPLETCEQVPKQRCTSTSKEVCTNVSCWLSASHCSDFRSVFCRCLISDAGRCPRRSVQMSQLRSASKYQSKSALRLVSYFFGCHLLRSCTGYCPEVLGQVSENGWSPRTIVDFSPAFLSFRSVSRRGFAARQPRQRMTSFYCNHIYEM